MIGETVGNFEIVAQIGKGAMGAVYLAQQKSVKTKVAIKVLAPDISKNATHVQRFFNEAVAVSQIHHSGIVKIYDVGTLREGRDDAQAYLVMEYLDGETLGARLKKRGRLPIAELADLGRQIASVLEATHAAGITHRDLKPENIFLVRDAELASGERVKILDFGIAKLVQPDTTSPRLTAMGASSIGTPLYMSPEQWHSLAEVDWRTDAYALGCIAFELACGRPPFVGESMADVCAKHLSEPPPVPSQLVPGLPHALDDLIARLLAKEPAERPTIREAMTVFTELARQQGLALTTLPPDRMSPFAPVPAVKTVLHETEAARPRGTRRAGLFLALGALAVVGIAGAAVVLTRGGSTATGATPDAARVVEVIPDAPAGEPARDAARVAVVTPDAASAVDAAVEVASLDAGSAVVEVQPDAGAVLDAGVAATPDAGTPVRTPTRTPPVRIGTLLAPVRGTVPKAAKAMTLDVCLDKAGHVDSVGPKTTPKELAEEVMRLHFPPHVVKGTPTPACGKLAIAARPAATTAVGGTKPDGPGPDGAKPDGTKPAPGEALSAAKINEVVQRNRIPLTRCGGGKLDASVRLRITVGPDGHGHLSSVSNAGGSSPDFPSCLQQAVLGLTFPTSARGGEAEVTVRFTKAPAPQGGGVDNLGDYPP